MRNYKGLALLALGVPLCTSAFPVSAQVKQKPTLNLTFVIPQGADPGKQITFTNFTTPITLTGSDLLSGITMFGEVPGSKQGTLVDIDKLNISFTFTGSQINFSSLAPGGWKPWSTTLQTPIINNTYNLSFFANGPVGKPGGSAPLSDNFNPSHGSQGAQFSFATLDFSIKHDPTGAVTNLFKNSIITITPSNPGFTRGSNGVPVPESGTMVQLALCLLVGTIPFAYIRRNRRTA